jgi:hypothetical protein
MRTKLFALYAVVAMVLAVVGPGIAVSAADTGGNTSGNASLNVAINQDDEDGSVTVEVMEDGTGVEDADVTVETVDDNDTYAGEGDYVTDEDGVVDLPAPEESVTVNVTAEADNSTAHATADLLAVDQFVEEDPFGQLVSSFVHTLIDSDVDMIGPYVASFAVENNPGNAPDSAGPPGFLTGEEDEDKRGPPGDDDRGPPEDRGPDSDDEEDDDDGGGGPPEGAGNGNGNGPPN